VCETVTGLAGCGATVVHDLVYNPAEGKLSHISMLHCPVLTCEMDGMHLRSVLFNYLK